MGPPVGAGPTSGDGFSTWRICRQRYADFSGEGARLYGGRWNHPGSAIVYTSGSLALASLEFFVHTDTDLLPDDLVSIRLEVPEAVSIEVLVESRLPSNWRDYPAPAALRDLGTAWARAARSCLLSVPSAVVPPEKNYLINPGHADFPLVAIGDPAPFSFDPRMWR